MTQNINLKHILTSVRDLKPPKAVPFHCLPVISWKGRVEISCPDGATPGAVQTREETDVSVQSQKIARDWSHSAGKALRLDSYRLERVSKTKQKKKLTDDAGLAPAPVRALQGRAHHLHVAGGVEGVVHAPPEM
jgi:hypothetical protein